jgi:hypothetical protein
MSRSSFGPAELRTVTRAHVIAWRKDLEKRELAPSSIRRKLSALSASAAKKRRDMTIVYLRRDVLPCWVDTAAFAVIARRTQFRQGTGPKLRDWHEAWRHSFIIRQTFLAGLFVSKHRA